MDRCKGARFLRRTIDRAGWVGSALALVAAWQVPALARVEQALVKMSHAEVQRWAASGLAYEVPASMWVWTDKYVYTPGEQVVLRWTVKANSALYPVTIVAYRQNNQTGAKLFLPNLTPELTDIFGRRPEEGFMIVRVPDVEKQVLIGPGGLFPAQAGVLPAEYGMHTFAVELRDWTGLRVLKRAVFKIGVVEGFEELSGAIESDRTLTNRKAYRLRGTVFVRRATLTIEPGTFIIGQPGSQPPSALVITRGARLVAAGTRSRPIVFTSALPFGQRRPGDWGGLAIAGYAPTNEAGGEGTIEGLPAGEDSRYGGNDPEWDCGVLRYVRVEFAGAELTKDKEINAFGWAGCGSRTVAEYLQAHYAADDAFEWFGGTMNARYLVATAPDDDALDVQLGYTGKIQYFASVQYDDSSGGDHGIEADNNEANFTAQPFTNPTVFNATFVGFPGACNGSCNGARWRRGVKGSWNNLVMTNFYGAAIDVRDQPTRQHVQNGDLRLDGLLLWSCNAGSRAGNSWEAQLPDPLVRQWVAAETGRAERVRLGNPWFRSLQLSDWDLRPALGSPLTAALWTQPPDDGFFDQSARFVGAFGEEDWTEEWTMKIRESDLAGTH